MWTAVIRHPPALARGRRARPAASVRTAAVVSGSSSGAASTRAFASGSPSYVRRTGNGSAKSWASGSACGVSSQRQPGLAVVAAGEVGEVVADGEQGLGAAGVPLAAGLVRLAPLGPEVAGEVQALLLEVLLEPVAGELARAEVAGVGDDVVAGLLGRVDAGRVAAVEAGGLAFLAVGADDDEPLDVRRPPAGRRRSPRRGRRGGGGGRPRWPRPAGPRARARSRAPPRPWRAAGRKGRS